MFEGGALAPSKVQELVNGLARDGQLRSVRKAEKSPSLIADTLRGRGQRACNLPRGGGGQGLNGTAFKKNAASLSNT